MKRRTYGVYVGDFSPIHDRQLEYAYKYMKDNNLDGIMFAPSYEFAEEIGDVESTFDKSLLLQQAFKNFASIVKEDLSFIITDIKSKSGIDISDTELLDILKENNRNMRTKTGYDVSYHIFEDTEINKSIENKIKEDIRLGKTITTDFMNGDYRYMYMNVICKLNITTS